MTPAAATDRRSESLKRGLIGLFLMALQLHRFVTPSPFGMSLRRLVFLKTREISVQNDVWRAFSIQGVPEQWSPEVCRKKTLKFSDDHST